MTQPLLLVLDTATRQPMVALAADDGTLIVRRTWESRHRHGEQLLSELDGLFAEAAAGPRDVAGIVVGTGPGSFTGLRIGLATAKVLAYSLGVPLVGVPTTAALAVAAARAEDAAGPAAPAGLCVTLPAGAADRYVAMFRASRGEVEELSPPRLVAGSGEVIRVAGVARLVAVELAPPEVAEDAVERGRMALAGLPAAMADLGARRLRRGERDDVATLVPTYVALPRGVLQAAEEMAWSPDLR